MLAAAISWLAASRVGRICAAVAAGLVALVTFGAWQRGQGRKAEQQRQKDADHAATRRGADAARAADRVPDPVEQLRRDWSR